MPGTTERAFGAREYLYTCSVRRTRRNSIFLEPVRESERERKREGACARWRKRKDRGGNLRHDGFDNSLGESRPQGVRVLVTPFRAALFTHI